jgi:trimeric autotransporter adhesin
MRRNPWQMGAMLLAFMMSTTSLFSQTIAEREKISSTYNLSKLQQLKTNFQSQAESKKQQAIQLAAVNGWEVLRSNNDGSFDELVAVSTDGQPIYYTIYNVNAAKSTRANHLNIGGSLGLSLDGQNMTAHVWDGGATRVTHQEFDGAGGNNRVTINDGVTTINGNSFHAQHVTGTIVASGFQAAAKGMAPQAKALTHDWNNDLAEATAEAASGMLISNHSYGYRADLVPDWYFGAYLDESRDWDNLLYNSPYYLMVVAAGNDGNDNSSNGAPLNGASSYDKLTGHSTSKNNMVVANANDANIATDGTLNSVTINSSSSEGPTDDLRIKPDITGNGTNVYSTYDNADNAYNSITGTSMASPNVTGTLLLLQQHYNNVNGSFMRSATLKGLALHTADDAGTTGPDVIFGWGLLNAKRAAQAISANGNGALISELTLSPGQTYTTTVNSDGTNPLMASISWTDPAGTANTGTTNLTTPVLVNDLDIRVSNGTTYSPYRLTSITSNSKGDNNVDPFERVDVTGAAGSYTITVTHKGSLSGGSQNFSLVVTGVSGTPPVCNATVPTGLNASGVGSSTATLGWGAVTGATYDVRYRQTGTSTWTTTAVSGTTTALSGLAVSTQYEAQVRSKCSGGATSAYSSSANFTTTAVQLNYCASNGNSVADEYISRVQVGTINNVTGASSGGYGNFTAQSTNATKGVAVNISVTPTWTGTKYNEGYSAWIDYNQDGDFTDAGEQVWSQSATQATPVSGSFTVPASAANGATRMRVTMQYNAVPSSCGSFNYGEVEDYTINISAGTADTQAPSTPTSLSASSITHNSFSVSWSASTDNVGVTGYNVFLNGVSQGTTTSTSYAFSGLAETTTYAVAISAYDAAGNTSAQGSTNVSTVAAPDTTAPSVPSSLSASSVTQTTLTLNWTASTDNVGVTGYDVYQGAANIGTVTTNSANITGLTAGTSYAFNVRAKDAAGNVSAASNTVNVTTQSAGMSCTSTATLPYSEGFESGFGAWTNQSGDDLDWTRRSGSTPSSSTGPSSASAGSFYMYVEASSPNYPSKVTRIESPCYDLSGASTATFSFKYHMYGATMGTLALQASTNGTTWTSVWSQSGNKGNSWLTANVNLNAYAGATLKLRFVGTTGSSYTGDMAVDAISFTSGGGGGTTNVALTLTFDNYPEETSWQILNGSTVVASGGTYASQADGSTLVVNTALAIGCYSFVINDVYGDGICCSYGAGSYSLADGGTILASGGSFGSSETTAFCVGGATSSVGYTISSSIGQPTSVDMYPNPAVQTLNIASTREEATYLITNMMGQIVSSGQVVNGKVDVSRIATGMYMIQLLDKGGKTLTKKFVKE